MLRRKDAWWADELNNRTHSNNSSDAAGQTVPHCYEFQSLLVFLDVCHWALNDHFNALNILTTYLGSILILPSHLHTDHQSDIPLSRFQTKVLMHF